MKKRIDLEEILKNYDIHTGTRHKGANIDREIRDAMLELCKQLLELAAENAEIDYEGGIPGISKQSILNSIKQVE